MRPSPGQCGSVLASLVQRVRNILGVGKLCWQVSPGMSIAAPLLTIAAGILPAAYLVIVKLVVDTLVAGVAEGPSGESAKALLRYVLLLLAVKLFMSVIQQVNWAIEQLLQRRLTGSMQEQINQKALSLDLAYFESPVFFDRFRRAQQEVGSRPYIVFSSVLSCFRQLGMMISFFCILASYSVWIVLAMFLVVLPTLWFQAYYGQLRWSILFQRTANERKLSYLQQLMTNNDEAKEVRIFGLGTYLLESWKSLFWRFYAQDRSLTLRLAFVITLTTLVQTTAGTAFYGLVIYSALIGTISIGTVFMLNQAMENCLGTLAGISQSLGLLYENSLFLSNLSAFFEQLPLLKEPAESKAPLSPVRGRLQFENITFAYPGTQRAVLRNLSFTIDPGERIALVGENGAGKTTIVKLLARLYDPTEGAVSVDGVDLRDIRSSQWQHRLTVIFQDFVRYMLTVRENIGFGDVNHMADERRLDTAAHEAGVATMIDKLPGGWDSMLGRTFEGGCELSTGQWQRVALARALFSSAEVLILDEPTASLDAKQEFDLFQRFEKLTEGKTTILISHRLSSARLVNRVFFLEDGEIVEQGSHEQLMALDGKYADMFRRQACKYTQSGGVLLAGASLNSV